MSDGACSTSSSSSLVLLAPVTQRVGYEGWALRCICSCGCRRRLTMRRPCALCGTLVGPCCGGYAQHTEGPVDSRHAPDLSQRKVFCHQCMDRPARFSEVLLDFLPLDPELSHRMVQFQTALESADCGHRLQTVPLPAVPPRCFGDCTPERALLEAAGFSP